MKVKDLIEKLKTFDGELDVVVFNGEFENEVEYVELDKFTIESIGEYYRNKNGNKNAIIIH